MYAFLLLSFIYMALELKKQIHQDQISILLWILEHPPIDRYLLGEARSLLDALYMPYKVDLVDLNAVSKNFREIVLREGILWSQPNHE